MHLPYVNRTVGYVRNDLKGKAGAEVTDRTEEVVDAARDITAEEPSTSARRLASQLDINRSTTTKIMRKDIRIFPYKIEILQFIPDNTTAQRWNGANQILDFIDSSELDYKMI